MTEILFKVALNTINLNQHISLVSCSTYLSLSLKCISFYTVWHIIVLTILSIINSAPIREAFPWHIYNER